MRGPFPVQSQFKEVKDWFNKIIIEDLIMVHVRVGKEFPYMGQNEGEIKFITVGDAVTTAGQLKGELTLNRGPWSIYILSV